MEGHPASTSHATDLRREAYTMALYVAICLLAALTAVADRSDAASVDLFLLIWGTTVGLAVAHWLAFRLASRLVAAGSWRQVDVESAVAQVAGAATVAVLASLPLLILPTEAQLAAARLLLAAFLALVGFAIARESGASVMRSLTFGAGIAAVAFVVAVVKNALGGH